MSSYTNIDEAFDNAVSNVDTIATSRGWSDTQYQTAIDDIGAAYDANTGAIAAASAYWDSFSLTDLWEATPIGAVASLYDDSNSSSTEEANAEQARNFWEDLYIRAQKNWSTFPNGASTISWVGKAAGASVSAIAEIEANEPGTIIAGGVKGTAKDLVEVADKGLQAAQNPAVWYGLAAAATLGALVYVKMVFRL